MSNDGNPATELDAALADYIRDDQTAAEVCNGIGSTDEEKATARANVEASRARLEAADAAHKAAWAETDRLDIAAADKVAEERAAYELYATALRAAQALGPRPTKATS